MKTKSAIGKRIAAAVGALAVGVAGLALGAGAANAAPSVGNIDPNTKGTLTIHKYAGDPNATANKAGANDGNKLSDGDAGKLGTALNGVVFQVRSVQIKDTTTNTYSDVNLNSPEGWDQIKGLDASKFNPDGTYPGGNYQLGWNSGNKTTANDGSVTLTGLEHTLYYVVETDSTGATKLDGTAANVVQKAQPFLVTVPFPQSNNKDTWIYDIHAYPKNALADKPTKTVEDPGKQLALGDTVNWTINVPLTKDGGDYQKLVVQDQLDADHLTANTQNIVVKADNTVFERKDNICVPTDGFAMGDYCVTPKGNEEAAVAGQPVVLTLTTNGLAKINTLRKTTGSHNVSVTLPTTVKALSDTGMIKNQGTTITNNGTGDVTQKTNETKVNHGSVELTKTSAIEGHTLKGAEFELWTAKADGSIGEAVKDQAGKVKTYVTNDDGKLKIDGIWTGTDDQVTAFYYLKETKAPAGYVLPSDPTTKVLIHAGGTTQPATVTVKNEQQNGPNLPLTGSAGTVMLLAIGAALVLGGTVTSQIARKNRKSAQVR